MDARVVTMVSDNDGGDGAIVHANIDEARAWAMLDFTAPDRDPVASLEEIRRFGRELADISFANGTEVASVRGSDSWKETYYFALLQGDCTSKADGEQT